MSDCPYSDDELDKWDGVNNPMGVACNDCGEYECEHNLNGDPDGPEFSEDDIHEMRIERGE
jgi:hypothetical protein